MALGSLQPISCVFLWAQLCYHPEHVPSMPSNGRVLPLPLFFQVVWFKCTSTFPGMA